MRNLMKAALASALILSGCASGKNYANPRLAQLKGQHILTLVDRADFADVCVRGTDLRFIICKIAQKAASRCLLAVFL